MHTNRRRFSKNESLQIHFNHTLFDSLIFLNQIELNQIGDIVAVGEFNRKKICVYGFEFKISILVYN